MIIKSGDTVRTYIDSHHGRAREYGEEGLVERVFEDSRGMMAAVRARDGSIQEISLVGLEVAKSAPEPEFRPGLHRHYKGGGYTATEIVYHHETKAPYVKVVSHEYGTPTIRPLRGIPGDEDGFLDIVKVKTKTGHEWRRRFQFVGDFPSDDKARERIADSILDGSARRSR